MSTTPVGTGGKGHVADLFADIIADAGGLADGELLEAAAMWVTGAMLGAFSSGSFLDGDENSLGGRSADRPGVLTHSEAAFLVEGFAILEHLQSGVADNGSEWASQHAALQRELLRRMTWSSEPAAGEGICSGVVMTVGAACKSRVTNTVGSSVCGRHRGQDLLNVVLAVFRTYPRFPGTPYIGAGGSSLVEGAIALCSICPRARDMEAAVTECLALGGDGTGSGPGLFSCLPTWLAGSAGCARYLDRPGGQFCLVCAARFPIACQLVAWLPASEDAASDGDIPARGATLPGGGALGLVS